MAMRGQAAVPDGDEVGLRSLLGREEECQRLRRLVEEARAGHAASVWIVGEPGSGKTAICRWVKEMADGFRAISIGCVEGEAALALGTVLSIVRPLRPVLDRLPDVYRATLLGVLGDGPGEPDPFALGVAVLALLAEAAEAQPLVLVIDDVQWMDPASRVALAFALRRLDQDAVLAVLASSERAERLGLASEGEPLVLGGLSAEAGIGLLGSTGPIAPEVAARVAAATAGLPLALVEVDRQLSEAQRMGRVALPDPLPVGDRLLSAYRQRIGPLPASSRLALGVVAAAGSATHLIPAALAAKGLSLGDLSVAESVGATKVGPAGPRFVHPLIRAVALEALEPAERRDVHRTLAFLSDRIEDRAYHLVQSCSGPSDEIAGQLESMADALGQQQDVVPAAGVWLDAARLSPPGEARIRRLQRAAALLATVGRMDEAESCFAEIRTTTRDPLARADAVIGSTWMREFALDSATLADEAISEADRIEAISPRRALLLRCLAGARELNCGKAPWHRILFPVQPDPGIATLPPSFETTFPAHILGAQNRMDEAARWLTPGRVRVMLDTVRDDSGLSQMVGLQMAAVLLVWMERLAEAEQLTLRGISLKRQARHPLDLGFFLGILGEIQWRTGRWADAEASLSEGRTLAAQTNQPMTVALCGGLLARLAAGRGTDDYRQAADAILSSRSVPGMFSARLYAMHALGLGHLSVGRYTEAARVLDQLARVIQPVWQSPTLVPYQADRVEALIRTAPPDLAGQAWRAFRISAERARSAWAYGTSLRLEAMLAGDQADVDSLLGRSAELLGEQPFERARTQLCWGESLRRRRELRRSRKVLAAAAETFDDLQAVPWADRARAELRASGDRTGPARPSPMAALTPQELQVAMTVSDGASNREVAALLFISPKTVEHHLSRIYMKLGLRSRSELVRLVLSSHPA